VVGPVLVYRLPGKRTRAGPLSYLLEYGAFVWRCKRLLERDPRFRAVRVVHVHTLPDFLIWAAAPARKHGARVILDLHEAFPEFAAAKYPGIMGRIASSLARVIERSARRRADVTVVVNHPIETLLAERPIGRPERCIVIHNSADPADFGAAISPITRQDGGRLEIVYHGTLMRLYGLDVAIRGVVLAAARGLPVNFLIIGDGPERQALIRLTRGLSAEAVVTFEAPVAQEALPVRLAGADAGVVPTKLDGMTRYSLSNKLLEYVHLGLPVLASRLPSYERYLSDEAAWFWTPGDPSDFARAIQAFARATTEERHCRAVQAQRDLASVAWPIERARLIATYKDLIAGE
jgi:glycosyltransferase involved in cell wall biosynthesis